MNLFTLTGRYEDDFEYSEDFEEQASDNDSSCSYSDSSSDDSNISEEENSSNSDMERYVRVRGKHDVEVEKRKVRKSHQARGKDDDNQLMLSVKDVKVRINAVESKYTVLP